MKNVLHFVVALLLMIGISGCQDDAELLPIEGDVIVDFSDWEEGRSFVGYGFSKFQILAVDYQTLSINRWDTDESAVGVEIKNQGLILDWNKLDLNFSSMEIEYYLEEGAGASIVFLDKKSTEKQSVELSENSGTLQTMTILLGQEIHYSLIRSLVINSEGMLIKKVSLRRPVFNI